MMAWGGVVAGGCVRLRGRQLSATAACCRCPFLFACMLLARRRLPLGGRATGAQTRAHVRVSRGVCTLHACLKGACTLHRPQCSRRPATP